MLKFTMLLSLSVIIALAPATAQKKSKKGKGAPQAPPPKKSKFDELIKGAEKIEGFFNFYRKDGKLLMEIPEDRLNQDFLMIYEIAKGIGTRGLFGGTMLNLFEGDLVALEKYDGKVFLVQKPHRYVASGEEAIKKAVDLTFGSSVLESAKVAATRDSDKTILIDVYGWFVSDLSQISSRVKAAVSTRPGQPGRASLDKSRSHLEKVKSFPKNSNITAKLTFRNSERFGPRTISDNRYLPVSIHYTLAELPENPMVPRLADDRVGFFMTVHKDFGDDNDTFFKRYVNRWRLECDGPAGADGLCDVQKPITYYIDRTVPEKYRKVMMEGVEAWKSAFEAAGFRNGIKAEMLPDDADPEDIRYATLRWNTSDQSGYGAIGPSTVDPRSGEILDADILFEANMFQGFKKSWDNYINPSLAIQGVFEISEEEKNHVANGGEFHNFSVEMQAQGDLIKTMLVAHQLLNPEEPLPDEIFNEFVKWVTMHEVGHTLGLTHNFKSSYDTPLDKLHDKSFTEKNGVFSSVMEYPSPNIAGKGKENGHYYNPTVGSYDRWAISYGYTTDYGKAQQIARKAAAEGHSYGLRSGGPGALDPLVNTFDLGEDPLVWGKERADLIKSLYAGLPKYILEDNTSYDELTNAVSSMMFQYAGALNPAIKYIGGQYHYRHHEGDPGSKGPFEAIPIAKQREALQTIIDYGLSENAFELPDELIKKMGSSNWFHWGNNSVSFNGRVDYPYYEVVNNIQRAMMSQVMHPWRLARIRDTELKFGAGNTLGIPELFNKVSRSVWSEVYSKKNISAVRRDLQRAHIDQLTRLVVNAQNRTPADARAVARMNLTTIRGRINSALNSGGLNDYSKAHLVESKLRIEKALNAGLELKN